MEPLPSGWEMRFDEVTGRYYFVDHNTRSTQWQHPLNDKLYLPTGNNIQSSTPTEMVNKSNENDSEKTEPVKTVSYSYTELVDDVLRRARSLRHDVDNFTGSPSDREYTRLMATLEHYILELDAIGANGQDDVRSVRRSAVVEIQQLIQMLEFRSQITTNDDATTADAPPE